ncbi:MAG: hypothetical protein AB1393_00860 [Candidatus Edwardsbacteria bacterium]
MAKLTYAQKFSFAETVAEILLQNKQTFLDAGLDANKKLTQIQERNKKVVVADAKQEGLKAELKKATDQAVSTVEDSYKFASSTLEAMVGALGKDHPLSKRLRQLRDQMVLEALRGKKEQTG